MAAPYVLFFTFCFAHTSSLIIICKESKENFPRKRHGGDVRFIFGFSPFTRSPFSLLSPPPNPSSTSSGAWTTCGRLGFNAFFFLADLKTYYFQRHEFSYEKTNRPFTSKDNRAAIRKFGRIFSYYFFFTK